MKKDIFISYKNDGIGENFAARLSKDLDRLNYKVYFNPNEQHSGPFPERLRHAVEDCKDFIIIISQGCIDQLRRHDKIDWIREELLTAQRNGKNIIPLLMPKVEMPKDRDVMHEELRFFPDMDAIPIAEPYDRSPFSCLLTWLLAAPAEDNSYKNVYNESTEDRIAEEYTRLENDGSDEAAFEMAVMNFYGIIGDEHGCKRDFERAYELLKPLSSSDDKLTAAKADSMLAEMYYHGTVPRQKQSYCQALKYHERAKDVSGFSSRELSYLKSRGCGCDFDYAETVESYKSAIENGDSMAIVGLAKFYMSYGKFKEAAELYKSACDVLEDAEFNLAMLYRDGKLSDPPKPDFFRAAYHFQHAIDSGNCSADVYHELGRLYFMPTADFKQDFKLAQKHFTSAAELGSRSAQYKLGLMYEYGYVEKNTEKAIKYHRLAAEKGNAMAAYHLALIYQSPEIADFHSAFKYAKLAAERGVMEGEFIYAVFLYYGRGCSADKNTAYRYFSRAYEHGVLAAKLYLDKYEDESD